MPIPEAIPPDRAIPLLQRRDPLGGWPIAVAAALHVALLGGAGILIARPTALPAPPALPVEFVTPAEFEAVQNRSGRVPTTADAADTPRAPAPAPTAAADMTVATTLLAGAILDDPANRRIREALPTLERSERLIQLCNLEGLEQLRIATAEATESVLPDVIVAYAYADPIVAGTTLDAPGAAFHQGEVWRHLRLTCSAAADFEAVIDFRFEIGDLIPEGEWAAHFLVAVVPEDDG